MYVVTYYTEINEKSVTKKSDNRADEDSILEFAISQIRSVGMVLRQLVVIHKEKITNSIATTTYIYFQSQHAHLYTARNCL